MGTLQERPCESCGKPLANAVRASARFCSTNCRVRAHNERKGSPVVRLAAPPPATSDADAGGVAEAVRSRLSQVGRLDTVDGQIALALAAKLDGGYDTGSAKAATSRELRSVMAEIESSAQRRGDLVTDLRDRIAAKSGA